MLRGMIIAELVKGYIRGYHDYLADLPPQVFREFVTAPNHSREYRDSHAVRLMSMLAHSASDEALYHSLDRLHRQEYLHAT